MTVPVSAAVEGLVDEAVAHVLIAHVGGIPGAVYGKNGKAALQERIRGYNNAAQRAPWFILVDLDRDPDCAPRLHREWLRDAAPHLCFRVAVRAVEAWLLADREALARFLKVAVAQVPCDPETLDDPKRTLVDIARESRSVAIRSEMVPREGSGRQVGPAYPSRVIEYVRRDWRPSIAAVNADSLKRAIDCLQRLVLCARPRDDR